MAQHICMALCITLGAGLLFTGLPAVTSAQSNLESFERLEIVVSPPDATAGERVKLTLQGLLFDLRASTISWTVDGTPIAEGVGLTSQTLTLGAAGKSHAVSIVVLTPSGERLSAQTTLRVADVDLLWQASTYVPPWYRGAPLASSRSSVALWALPHMVDTAGRRVSADSLSFTWRVNGRVLGSLSGRGRDTLTVTAPFLHNQMVVEVLVEQESVSARKRVVLEARTPEARLYENHPTSGVISSNALTGSYVLENDEVTLIVEPFFMSGTARSAPEISYTWSLNGEPVAGALDPGLITLRPVGSSGEASLVVGIRNEGSLLQSARAFLDILFFEGSIENNTP